MASLKGDRAPACTISVQDFYGHSRCREVIKELPSDSECTLADETDDEVGEPQSLRNVFVEPSYSSDDNGSDSEDSESEIPCDATSSRPVKRTRLSNSEWQQINNNSVPLPKFTRVEKINITGESPIVFFTEIISAKMLEQIVFQTNLYALLNEKLNLGLTVPEMKTFLGVNIVMTYIKSPRTRSYWSSDKGLRMGLVANSLPVNRYDNILRFLHFVHNSAVDQSNTDRLYKIHPFLECLQRRFLYAAKAEKHQCIDEQIIPFKGRSNIKHYVANKSKKWGLEGWLRAGSSGYVNRLEVYRGGSDGMCQLVSLELVLMWFYEFVMISSTRTTKHFSTPYLQVSHYSRSA
ncbi:piggyBac transposable element-derived protein 2-like [Schistocerca gregaria]|uniref:piggyBac transposable element-derived protein 2-like n=1 Tax=Schistocerca gregaria TaxID=7010 RepID=UPI00211DEA4B|nr:piggyBac transposable element-derived protein 2-like [Schistocerca gregaria]